MSQETRAQELQTVVASLTRRRPDFLSVLLRSWQGLEMPDRCDVLFLIVENDDQSCCQEIVERSSSVRFQPVYLLETEPGIPFGRNRAAKYAIDNDADLLVFIDDDEVADQLWLKNLVEGYRKSKAVLLGAPLRAMRPEESLSWWQDLIYLGVENRYTRKEKRASRRADLSKTDGVTIVTNNWLAEVSLFSDYDIWFDEEMRFTGGTDTKFYHEVKSRGLATGWVKDAFVYEIISIDRLSFAYQTGRARDQASTNLHRKLENGSTTTSIALVPLVPKAVAIILLFIAVPFTRGRTLVTLARTLGWCIGRIMALFGYRSQLYSRTTGR